MDPLTLIALAVIGYVVVNRKNEIRRDVQRALGPRSAEPVYPPLPPPYVPAPMPVMVPHATQPADYPPPDAPPPGWRQSAATVARFYGSSMALTSPGFAVLHNAVAPHFAPGAPHLPTSYFDALYPKDPTAN
jgi:hypothetical protein